MKKSFVISALITLFINLFFFILLAFDGKSGPYDPSDGMIIGIITFAVFTILSLIISFIFVLATKHYIAKGIALAELLTVLVMLSIIIFRPF